MKKRLYRSNQDIMISGVCSGIAEYFDIDPTLVRIGTIILTIATSASLIIGYIIAMIIIPVRPANVDFDADIYDCDTNYNPENTQKKSKTIIGVFLISLGGFLLMDNYFWWFDKFSFWSLGLIALGVVLIVSTRKKTNDNN